MKKIIVIVLMLISASSLYAQVDNFRQELDFLFGQLDKTKVSSGYLAPYGIDGVDKADFNGILADTNTVNGLDLFRFIYADILTAKFNPTASTLPSVNSLNQTFAATDKNTLALFYANNNDLNESAIQLGLLRYVGGKLYDNIPSTEAKIVFPQTPKPYIARKLFAANPLTQYFDNTVTLKFNPALFYNNANVNLVNLWIKFGNGYTLVSPNSTISNTYTDSTGFHRIAIKAELSNGDIMETYTAVMVNVTSSSTASRYTFADISNISLRQTAKGLV